jgi:predicted nucleic acid-binding protein
VILVDSSVWIDYLRGTRTAEADKLDSLLGTERLAVGDLIVAEVLQGCADDKTFNRVKDLLGAFVVVHLCGYALAVQATRNHRALKALGVTVRNTVDTVIATRCIEDGYTLLHRDRDFEPFVAHLGLRSVF